MKIGMVTTQFAEVGGVENVVRSLSREMAEEHEVSLITRKREQNVEEFADYFEDVHEIENTESYLDYLRNGRKFFRQKADSFDVLHFHNWSPIIPAAGIDTPMVLTLHGTSFAMTYEQGDRLKALGYWPLEEVAVNIPDVVTSITRHHLNHFHTRKRTEMIRNGVDTEKFRPPENEERKQGLRDKWNVEGDGILIVGRHVRQKGHIELIEAVKDMEDYTLMIPSDGPLRSKLETKVDKLNVKAEFYGKVTEEELIELYQAADIFCLPSWGEGLPLTILEAMSSGLPVVVSDRGDNKEIVEEAGAGKAVEPRDSRALAENLRIIISRKEELADQARNYSAENLEWDGISSNYVELYRIII